MNNLQEANQSQVAQVPVGTDQHNLANILPVSSEIGQLWFSYFAESMSVCFLKEYVAKSIDPEIHPILQRALDVASQRVKAMEDIFNSFNHPIPDAFGEKDVDVNAKQLFSESFSISYTRLMHKFVLITYSNSLTVCSRSDFRNYFFDCIGTSSEIIQKATDLLLAKGLFLKAPSIVIPDRVDFVHDKNYFGSIFGSKRPINALEISHCISLMETKQLLRSLNLGYGQVVKSEKIRNFISQAKKLSDDQLKILGSILEEEDLPQPKESNYLVTDSTESALSDRLILCHITATISFIITEYGITLTGTARKDLAATYAKFILEILSLAKNGAELMIEFGWLERIPETSDRKKLLQH